MAQIVDKPLVVVTGATGFAGRALVPVLHAAGWRVRASGRDAARRPTNCEFVVADLSNDADFAALASGASAVVHLAARVHVMRERATDPLAEFRRTNVAPTAKLAEAAANQGAVHFLFASTVKVNGEATRGQPYTEDHAPCPEDPYAVSKLEAEQALREQAAASGLSATILRAPLVYGAEAKGNFARLLRLVAYRVPLPFGSVRNRRSFLFIGNFCSAVLAALSRPGPGTRLYLLSDGEDVSSAELIRRMAAALGRPARLFPFPVSLLRVGAAAAGFGDELRRITDSLVVDSTRIRSELDWRPPYSLDEGLALTVRDYSLPPLRAGVA